jgi:hypothetical protein
MMFFTGVAMTAFAAVLFLKFRPRQEDSRILCAIMGIMGLMAILSGPAGWKVQGVQLFLQLTVSFCCFAQLHREKRLRARRAARMRVHRPRDRRPRKMETCA